MDAGSTSRRICIWWRRTRAVASACIISQEHVCHPLSLAPQVLGAAVNRGVISTEMRAFNNLNWHRGGGVLQKIGLTNPFFSGEYAAAHVTGCQDGPDKKCKKMAAGLRHVGAHSVETNRMTFNGNISTFDLWDTETLHGGEDMELRETYFTTNGNLAQAVQQNRTAIHTVHNNTVRRARPADPTLTSSNGHCTSKWPDGKYELGQRQPHQSRIAHCPLHYYAKDHGYVPCTTCGMGTWASAPCSSSSDAVCSSWTECKPGQKESVSGNAVRDHRMCVSCTRGMEYQPLPDRASCFPTSVCEEPFIETIPPTLTTDRLCSCDTLACNKLITQLFEEMVCAEPTDEQLDVDGIRDTIRQMDAYEARRSCPGCTDTCECSAGFILVYDADSADCRPCDGVTEFSPSVGGSKYEPIEECELGQEEVAAPTRSSDRVCHDCSARTIDLDSDGSTGCQPKCAPGFEEVQAMTLLISDRVCDECPGGHVQGCLWPARACSCFPVTTCDAGEEETAEPTPTSDRVCSQCELGATFKPVERPGRVMPPRHAVRSG
ncbi:hypothetical protein PTSG_09682 [Salpingoeca rosetta]|uniref:TNFR-Cys domain-containing protein n=1 Tax=Salpingoeca rosetta (strain ATCC 50818 / BSB-021) TaxID=946362 RepID=F2ULP5_SALR5|nr:uncharacterized protein PTSG_09682 [Salpingoeca rosetta]EGD78044.1 hypothetical protein PTSG_09682 [Salpingoeca rosetta]|eukprot:XP_004990106.1 hypothetical protein PTSG_09682 [Salpingoeca rosetta]